MNSFFSLEYRDAPVPRRLYARLDQTEPLVPAESKEAVFAYDAVDAEWPGFGAGMPLDLDAPTTLLGHLRGRRGLRHSNASGPFVLQ